jgi:hypothetical protein
MSGSNEVALTRRKPKLIHHGDYIDKTVRRVMRRHWHLDKEGEDGASFSSIKKRVGYYVIFSTYEYDDGKTWAHVSVSRSDKAMPTWDDMVWVKEEFLGKEAKAIIVIPPRSEHVSIHDTCHHLWHCIDGDELPDFTLGTGSI